MSRAEQVLTEHLATAACSLMERADGRLFVGGLLNLLRYKNSDLSLTDTTLAYNACKTDLREFVRNLVERHPQYANMLAEFERLQTLAKQQDEKERGTDEP